MSIPTNPLQPKEGSAACDFLDLWLSDQERGVVRPLADYLARFPGYEEVIAQEWTRLTLDAGSPAEPRSPQGALGSIGPYRILRALGRGGQGTVYLALDSRGGGEVAVKVLDGPRGFAHKGRAERFRREAEILSRLDSPEIAGVVDTGLDDDPPWIAMRHVVGESLAAAIARGRSAQTPADVFSSKPSNLDATLQYFERAAAALHAAHQEGIIHRDVKPGNLMIDQSGAPVLLDFGLARDTSSGGLSLTQSAEVLGTLAYMSPEQIRGDKDLDRRTDIYSLGVSLFEALTLRRPFEAPNYEALLRAILEDDPLDLSQARNDLPKSLSTVVASAIHRDPRRRYPTALAFAEDLRRVREGSQPLARLPGVLERSRRAAVRHPVLATALVGGILMLVVGLVTAIAVIQRLEREQTRLQVERSRLEALRLGEFARTVAKTTPSSGVCLALDAAQRFRHPETIGVLYELLDRCDVDRIISTGFETSLGHQASFDPKGTRIALPTTGGTVLVIEIEEGRRVASLASETPALSGLTESQWSSDGRFLVTGHPSGEVLVWDATSLTLIQRHHEHQRHDGEKAGVRWLDISSDCKFALSVGSDGQVVVYGLSQAQHPRRLSADETNWSRAWFSPDGTRIAALSSWDHVASAPTRRSASVFDAVSGESLLRLEFHDTVPRDVSWSPDGQEIAIGVDDGTIRVHRIAADQQRLSLEPHGRIYWTSYSKDGALIYSGGAEGLVAYDARTGTLLQRFTDFGDRSVVRGALSPNGRSLAVISWDGTAAVVNATTLAPEHRYRGHHSRPRSITWSYDGRRLLTCEERAFAHVWHVTHRPWLPTLQGHSDRVISVSFSKDGRLALSASRDGSARVWNLNTLDHTSTFRTDEQVAVARFNALGSSFLVLTESGRLFIQNIATGESHQVLPTAGRLTQAWFLESPPRLFAGGGDGRAHLIDLPSEQVVYSRAFHSGAILCATFDELTRRVITGGSDRCVCTHDLDTGEVVWTTQPWEDAASSLDPTDDVAALVHLKKRGLVVAACEDQHTRTYSDKTGMLVGSIRAATPGFLATDPSEQIVLLGTRWAGWVARFNPVRQSEYEVLMALRDGNLLTALAISPNGHYALSSGKEGGLRVFDLERNDLHAAIPTGSSMVLDAAFSPDSSQIVVALSDGTLKIVPLDPVSIAARIAPRFDAMVEPWLAQLRTLAPNR